MPNTLYLAPTSNFLQTTLNGSITSSAQTITLISTTGMQAPGYVVIDRTDSNGVATPNAREVVSYTGISGSDLTGCVRPADGSTARSHSDGAVVETTFTTGMYNSLATIVATAVTSDGYLKPIASPMSIGQAQLLTLAVASIASVARLQLGEFVSVSAMSVQDVRISTRLEVSGASITGIGLFPAWRASGLISGATAALGGLLVAPKVGTFQWVSVVTRGVASAVSVVFDVLNNGTTIFAGITRPTIIGGGTYISTASINSKAVLPGQILRADIQAMGAGIGAIQDVTIQGRID
jgi:hypothetical protein